MILTCPNCSTRYMVKEDAISENGRTVRCAKCSTTWFVAAQPDALMLEDQDKAELTEVGTARRDDDREGRTKQRRQKNNEALNDGSPGAHVSIRDKADQSRRRRRIFGVAMIWVTSLALLGIAAFLAYLFRQPIVKKYPQTSAVYEAFNIKASTTGLILSPPETEYIRVEGDTHLVVNGTVQNLTKERKTIPLVKLSILNRNDEEITHWFVQPDPKTVAPKGRVTFAAEYPNPPVDAASLTYKLADAEG